MELIEACKQTAFEIMSKQDVSHDWHHIKRVVSWAEKIMQNLQGESFDRELVLCGCYLHDVADHKYSGEKDLNKVLWRLPQGYQKMDKLKQIIERTSWSVQLVEENRTPSFVELDIVRDADRLDALGVVGVLRAFGVAAKRRSPLVLDSTPRLCEQKTLIGKEDGSLVGHFYAKLFHIPEKLNFAFSKQEAEKLLPPMKDFVLSAFE
ncbi:metal-dependent phosphohydrolase [Golden Marseillevirus]|uniref:metal-dependent phosphohydrolase n=1 Tax=Golden Marseillevirus TaxID=1720526 RepID=UPI000877A8CA|nr:metal-dependent phosphohydrolase [Golden Marseillevirus]ALX27421.1 metal-dependent phosphohydrolase [Golden Marseillevirus]